MISEPRLVTDVLDLTEAEFAMDATPDRCALLDSAGRIARANIPWECASRESDPVAVANTTIGCDYLVAIGQAALHGNRDAGALHAQIRAVLSGETDHARLEFDRPLHSGGTARCVATIERVNNRDTSWVLVAFTCSTLREATPTSVPEAGFSVPSGVRIERLGNALNRLPSHAAILDMHGSITAVNAAWELFGAAAGADPSTSGVGVNYLAVCERAAASGDARAAEFGRGLGSVLRGERHTYTTDSRIGLGGATRRFRGRATTLSLAEGRFVLVTHTEMRATANRSAAASSGQVTGRAAA